jgi:hypothetical protein
MFQVLPAESLSFYSSFLIHMYWKRIQLYLAFKTKTFFWSLSISSLRKLCPIEHVILRFCYDRPLFLNTLKRNIKFLFMLLWIEWVGSICFIFFHLCYDNGCQYLNERSINILFSEQSNLLNSIWTRQTALMVIDASLNWLIRYYPPSLCKSNERYEYWRLISIWVRFIL